MCGITGHVNFIGEACAPEVEKLVYGIRHRGPDDEGLWVSPLGECVLGHARLSVIDLSPLGHQPMLDSETGNSIVFNGEIYNFQILRQECEKAGYKFRSNSDTEVILAMFRRLGISCLARLRGMFAFALWEERNKRLYLARDRAGKKPLNYALTSQGLIFCSEIDPLARHPAISREMDMEALELYLQLQYIPAPWTIYKSIRKLPPASFAVFDASGFSVEKYWEVDYRRKLRISEEEALDGLEEKLTEAVRLRMISDVSLGALLSGGVDSSLVVALMTKLSNQPVRTFSVGFREKKYDELPYAAEAASICGTAHCPEILEGYRAEELLPLIVRRYGEPYADSSAIPSFLLCRTARGHVTVALNGDGGDELLGGYHRYWLSRTQLRMASLMSNFIAPEMLLRAYYHVWEPTSIPLRAVRKLVRDYAWPESRSLTMYNEFWNDEDRARLMGMHARRNLLPQWRSAQLGEGRSHADEPVDRMLWLDNHAYLPGCLLVKMDIASMHCGLETRSPLLDHEVIEYCASLPVEFKVSGGIGKYLLKKLAERYFPPSFVYRGKMGFGIPVGDWLRGPLRRSVEITLQDAGLMAPLNLGPISKVMRDFYSGETKHSSRVWALFMYGNWKRYVAEGDGQ
jgi:asparagine synthase (glutamine-hydrolysing)